MTDELVAVRDSKDPQSGHFVLTPEAWRGLLAVAKKHGEQ